MNNNNLAGVSVVLRPATNPGKTIPLDRWLPDPGFPLAWVPLARSRGVIKAMPVVTQPQNYPALFQSICQQIPQNQTIEWQGDPYDISGVELEPHDLYVIQITLKPQKPLPPTLGRAMHALFFSWIAAADDAIAAQLHQSANRPFVLSTPRNTTQQITIRIALLQKDLLSPLLWGINQALGIEISITGVSCFLCDRIKFLATSDFKNLHQQTAEDRLTLQFCSPTSFKQKKHIQPFPLPELVFGSLQRRWNAFAPPALHFPAIDWHGLVSACDLKTRALRLEGGAEIGVQGWVTYQFPDPKQARIAAILARYAFFAGVGRKTAMGMGQTRLRQPKSVNRKS